MAVLVTGASGFVGTWLVRKLVERGDEVHVLHRKTSSLDGLQGLNYVSRIGDVTELKSLQEACLDVDTVFHLAGVIGYSRAARPMMDEVNIGGTQNVIRAIQNERAPKLVYMSSVVAVGASFDGQPLNEDSPYNIGHLNLGYFETKRIAEELVIKACKDKLIQATIVNPSTIYGAGDAQKGSRKTQLKVARGSLPFFTSGGVSIVSVHDVIDAILVAQQKGRQGERYILSGENISIQELFRKIAQFAGVQPPKIFLPNPVVHGLGWIGDRLESIGKKGPLNSENAWTAILFHWFEHQKATRELGFNPRPADEALRESVEWMKGKGLLQ